MRLMTRNLVVQFSIASLLIMASVGLVISVVLSNKIHSWAVSDLVDEAVGASESRLLSVLTPEDLDVPMTGSRYDRFHEFVQSSIVSDRTARVKIWARDGTIIYASNPAAVGERFPNKQNLLKALSGQNAVEVKLPKDTENERERYLGTLMEVYTPIIFPGTTEPRGSFEIYQYYEPTERRIREMRRATFLTIGLGLLVLYGSLLLLIWRAQRAMQEELPVGEQSTGASRAIASQARPH
jgi:hypothetical protein